MTTAPMNPLAGPAGPGKYSTRTDNLDMGSLSYGEGKDTQAILSGAPLAQATSPQPAPVTGLYDPTQRPNEPVTSGINMGAGVGSDALMMNQIKADDKDIVAKYLPSLSSMASMQDTPQSFRAFVSFLQGSL